MNEEHEVPWKNPQSKTIIEMIIRNIQIGQFWNHVQLQGQS